MKSVFLIAIVAVAMIGVMVPSVFAQNVYIQIDELPEWADYASNVMYLSTEAWKEANEGLEFWVVENSSDADFRVKWVKDFGGEYVGYAYGNQFIEVGLGDSNCLNKWNPYSEKYISHIMKHEIGHIFGHEHDNNPDSIMYPIALNLEYGLVEEEYRLTEGYGQFIPFCTIKDLTSYDFSISTTDETYGFDYYIIPSINEFDKWVEGKVFQHYSNKDCFGEGWLTISGTCKGVSAGSGIMVLVDSELTTPLVTITVQKLEKPNIINSKSMLASKNYIDFEKVPSVQIIHDTATIDVNIFGDTFDFSHSFYQNKDNSIRFENGDGRTIHKYAEYASIGKLFDSLGMSFTNDCLIFSDGKSFCNNKDYRFTFYVNGQTHYLLSQYVFEDGDRIKIIYESIPKTTSPTQNTFVPFDEYEGKKWNMEELMELRDEIMERSELDEKSEKIMEDRNAKLEAEKESQEAKIVQLEAEKENQQEKIAQLEAEQNGGGCLIATATYGSELSPQVQQLRELRDNQLMNTESGSAFMSTFNDIYYSFSPVIADYERENPLFKEIVKIAITPMISSLSLMENANSESEVISLGLSVIMLNLGMYLGVPAVVIVGIRRRI